MSIAKLFVKVFNEDIFEKLADSQTQPTTEEQKQQEIQDGDNELKKHVVVGESEMASTSSAELQPYRQSIPKVDDMCLPE